MITDALGNEIIIGNWYGYSRNDGGFSHVNLGRVKAVNDKTGNVRLVDCKVTRWLYGDPSDFRADKKPADVSIRSSMIFPVPPQD